MQTLYRVCNYLEERPKPGGMTPDKNRLNNNPDSSFGGGIQFNAGQLQLSRSASGA